MPRQTPQPEPAFRPSGFFAFRTALLPLRVLVEWADGMTAPRAADPKTVETAVARDRDELIRRLRTIVTSPEVREALFVASPSTDVELERWLASPDARDARLERTLARYVQRMAGRATPFGLFAGCSVGRLGDRTNIAVTSRSAYRRYSRLDNDYLFALTAHLSRQDQVRRALRYRPNSSLYRLAGRWRYVQTVDGDKRRDNLVALEADEYLEAIVTRARDGATLDEMVDHVLATDPDGDITREEADAYVMELVKEQVVVSDLTPIVTGIEALDDALEQIRAIPSLERVAIALGDVRERLADIDRSQIGVDTERYRTVHRVLDGLGVKTDLSRLFQVDMIKPAPEATCGVSVVSAIAGAVHVLQQITPVARMEPLRRFREAFTARYERREMPLVEVLDEESGIGFDRSTAPTAENAPLLNGVPFPPATEAAPGSWTARDLFLLSKIQRRSSATGYVWELSDNDLDRLATAQPGRLPDTFSVMASVAAPTADPDTDFQVFIRHVHGPSGANLLGRFCHADPELQAQVKRHLALEESFRSDAVFAEIVHLPDGRLGNILARPVLRSFEITYLGRSGAPSANQIPISDVLVSVHDESVVLRSARLGREVIPRMTNAHNHSRGLGIYRFLCALQSQSVTSYLEWTWGALEGTPFLPRVVRGPAVLSRARWRTDKEQIAVLTTGSFAEQFAAVTRWRIEHDLPRFVALVDGDNELPIDFENVLSLETFLHIARKRGSFALVEMFPGPDVLGAQGPEGRFAHELIVPFVRIASVEERGSTSRPAIAPRTRRSFAPGSEWLYVKWYAGTSSVDALLSDVVADFVRGELDAGAIDRWFFIRYADPDWHLRLRVHGEPDRLRGETQARLRAALDPALADGRAWRVQVDTYEREIERYGGDAGIVPCEEIFWRDSESVIEILQSLPGDEGLVARWRLCLRAWDLMLSDFGLDLEARRTLTKDSRAAFARQFAATKNLDRALGDRFREQRKALESLFDERQESTHPLAGALRLLRRRSELLEPVMHALRGHAAAGRLPAPLTALAGSLLHMHANRMLRSAHHAQEFVLYDFLDRLYESQLARARGRGRGRNAPVES